MRLFSSLSLLAGVASALTPEQWRTQSIYQVITDRFALANGSTTQPCDWGSYCGGTWQGIINKLDYIKGMGFTAVWISPIVQNIPTSIYGQPYHGYWANDMTALNSNFGTAADLQALSAALHARGMYLMVDIVANHMASPIPVGSIKYTQFRPFNDPKYYHPYCPIDWSNATSVEVCWMGDTKVPLPDLRTEDAVVQQAFQSWIKRVVQQFSIDGLRLDSALQTDQQFWPGFVSASGVYSIGEVLDGDPKTLCQWQNYMPGMFNYAAYYWLIRAFSSTSATMAELANNVQWLSATCQDVTLLGNFIENHDQPRFPSITTDAGLVRNAISFTVFNDGIPVIYQGQEQGFSGAVDPYNREPLWPSLYSTKAPLYTFISALNAARRLAITKDSTYAKSKSRVVYSDTKTLVTAKGNPSSSLMSLYTNSGAGSGARRITLLASKTGINPNTRFTDLLTCNVFTSDSSGNLPVSIMNGLPRALYLTSALTGSDVCAYTNTGSAAINMRIQSLKPSSSAAASPLNAPASASSAPTTITTSTQSSSSTSGCTVAVMFRQSVTTQRLEKISVVGSIPELGNWSPPAAFNLSGAAYTSTNPIWSGTINLPAGTAFDYKFIKYNSTSNALTWEADPNRMYTLPKSCASSVVVSGSWQG